MVVITLSNQFFFVPDQSRMIDRSHALTREINLPEWSAYWVAGSQFIAITCAEKIILLKLKTKIGCFCLVALSSGAAQGQTWSPMGPAPVGEDKKATEAGAETNVSGITQGSFINPATGAMSAILPVDANVMYAGAVNGGVWKTSDGGQNWTAIGDKLPSLSISTMTFDASNQKKLWAGFGHKSAMADVGGYLGGLAVYDTTSQSWSAPAGNASLAGQNITQVAVNGSNIYVAAKDVKNNTGIWISTTGGNAFTRVPTGNGLPNGDVTSLVQYTKSSTTTVYAGVIGAADDDTGVYASKNNGANWEKVNGVSANPEGFATTRIMLSVANDGTVATSVLSPKDKTSIVYVYQIKNTSGVFTAQSLGMPIFTTPNGTQLTLYNGGQFYPHASLLVDPNNPNIVYIGADTQPTIPDKSTSPIGAKVYNGNLFRGVFDPATGKTTWEPLTNNYAANNSAPHADSRFLFLDAKGNLLETDDGGVYYRTNPASSSGAWMSLNGNLQTSEMHTARWNSLTHSVLGAAQDNGTSFQPLASKPYQYAVNSGDGGIAEVNPNWAGDGKKGAALYSSYIHLESLYRTHVDANGNYLGTVSIQLIDNGTKLNDASATAKQYFPFTPSFALNINDPTRFAAGGYRLYVGQDTLELVETAKIPVIPRSEKTIGFITLAYGASDSLYALLGGTGDRTNLTAPGKLFYTSNALSTDAKVIYSDTGKGFQAALFDRQYGTAQIYLTDSASILRISKAVDGKVSTPTNISGNLPAAFNEKRALAHVYNNGVSALVAAGAHRPGDATSVAVDNYLYSLSAPATVSTYAWSTKLGSLPNAQVFGLDYSVADDVLLANLLGRGAFALYDVTTFYSEATRLVFGQAQNNSAPTAAQLTDGTDLNGAPLSRALIKNGSGTLDLTGKSAGYSGGTFLNGGAALVDADGNLGATGKSVSFNTGTLKFAQSFALDRPLTMDSGGGVLNLNGLSIAQGNSPISGVGQFGVTGGGFYTLTRTNIYLGGTSISGGSQIIAAANDQLGADKARVTLNDASLYLLNGFGSGEKYTFNRPIYVGLSSGLIYTEGRSFSYTGGLIESTESGKWAGALYFVGTPFTMGANLKLNAFWGSDLTVPKGMTLSGSGGATGTLSVYGKYDPGNSPGKAEFPGSVVLNPGSVLGIEIDGTGTGNGAGNYDRIVSTGVNSTFTAGGSLDPVLRGISAPANNNFSPSLGQGFRIVTAPGGVLGSFSNLTQPLDGLLPGTRFDTVYGGTDLTLYPTPASYANLSAAGVASNTNRQQVGNILEGIRPAAGLRENNASTKLLFDGLAPQTVSSLPVGMDQLAGLGYAQLIGMNFENSKFLVDQTMFAVATQRRGEGNHLMSAPAEATLSEPREEVWGRAMGRLTSWRGDDTGYTMNDALGGIMGGAQKRLNAQTLAGFSLAYAGSSPSMTQNMGGGPMQNLQLMGYASRSYDNGFYLQGSAGGGGGQITASRNVSMLNASYNSSIRTGNLAAAVLAGWGTTARDTVRYEGSLGLNYLAMRNFGFTDSGSQSAYALTGNTGTNNSFTASIGGSVSVPFRARGIDWRVSAAASVAHEFADNRVGLNVNLMGQPIQVQSGAIGRDRLNLGLSVSGYVAKQTSVALDVTNQSATSWNATAAMVSVNAAF